MVRSERHATGWWHGGFGQVSAASLVVVASLVACLCSTCLARDYGITYSLVPRADRVWWDKDVGLDDAYLYGGAVAARLDPLVTLQGYFLTNHEVSTDPSRVSAEFADQDIRLSTYGADVILKLNRGPIAPFLTCGGGIVRFDPDSGDVFEQISLRVGGGLRYEFMPRLYGQISAEDLFYRADRRMLSGDDPDTSKLRGNLVVSAALGIDLGGRPAVGEGRRQARLGLGERLTGGVWLLEPVSGRLRFDDQSRLGDHEMVGGRLGVGLTENLNLCGYYWRGMEKGYKATEDLQSFGGEAQFFLAEGRGALPYLVMGGGKLDFSDDFRDADGRSRSDKALVILGAGVAFPVNDFVRLDAGVRDYILSESDFDDVGSPDELRHSLAVSGGLSFLVGRSRGEPVAPAPGRPVPGRVVAEAVEVGRKAQSEPAVQPGQLQPPPEQGYQTDKVVVIPAPSVGEIYVRYGEPGGVSVVSGQTFAPVAPPMPPPFAIASQPKPEGEPQAAPPAPQAAPQPGTTPWAAMGESDREALRRMIDEELVAALRASAPRPESGLAGADQAELMARRIADDVERRLQAASQPQPGTIIIEQPQPAAPQPAQPVEVAVEVPPGTPGEVKVEQPSTLVAKARRRIAYTHSGINLNDPVQWVLGARFDVGPARRGSSIWIVPEVDFGLFNEGSFMLVGNAQYDFSSSVNIRKTHITPYLYSGLGLLHFGEGAGRDENEAVLNLGYGVTFNISKFNAYVEHQGVDLFSLHRLLFGLRWGTTPAKP
ncbi:MAG: hypothetical protein WAW06_02970 [bacterium]